MSPAIEPEVIFPEGLCPEEMFQTLLQAYHKTKNPKYLKPSLYFTEKYEWYPEDPVSCEKWLFDEKYMGHVSVWPLVKLEFLRIMEANPRPMRVILKGSIGWGKTFLSTLIMARLLYELACLRYPQVYYGMSPSSQIILMNVSVTGGHAKRVMFTELLNMLDGSPWFQTKFPRNKRVGSILEWHRKNIAFLPGNSSELSALGANLFGGVIEEANFYPVVRGSSRIRNPEEREWDQAKKLHDSIIRRIYSRYQRMGRVPGMLVLNSSANYPDDFLERLAGEMDPHTIVIDHSQWETQPTTRFSGEKFHVFVGDGYHRPRVIGDVTNAKEWESADKIEPVPIEYEQPFKTDLDGAIRDIMGKNVRSTNKFFENAERIYELVDESIPIPFPEIYDKGIPFQDLYAALKWDKLLNPIGHMRKGRPPLPLMHPGAPRFAHIDLSGTAVRGVIGDNCGVCVGHIGEMKEVRHFIAERGEVITEVLPVVYTDLILKLMPTEESSIEVERVREILYDLSQKCGFRFARITYDSYQSLGSIQVLQKRFGEDVVGILKSGEKKGATGCWWVLKDAINEMRVKSYYYEPLLQELVALERNPVTGVIDHPVNGHDDVAVALAGMVFNAMQAYDLGVADRPQMGIAEKVTTSEEKLERESQLWLMGKDKKPEKDDFDEKFWDVNSMSASEVESELKELSGGPEIKPFFLDDDVDVRGRVKTKPRKE